MSLRRFALSSPRVRAMVGVAWLVLALLILAVILPLGRSLRAGRSQLYPLTRSDSSCTMALTTTLSPDNGRLCDPVDITTTFTAACPACPDGLNVVFIQDDTPYPDWQKRVSLQALEELQRYALSGRPVSVGVIHYNGAGVRVKLRPTLNVGAARGPLVSFNVAHDPRALFLQAATQGVAMIREGRRLHGDASNAECEFVIFFVYTKVYMADKGQEMIQAGRTLLRTTPNLYVGCPHQHPEECTIWEPQVPKSARYYTEDPEASKLLGMVKEGLRNIDSKGAVRMISLSTDQWIPNGLKLIPGSFNVVPNATVVEGEKTRLTWDWRSPKLTDPVTLTFKAEPQTPGDWQSELANTWRDSANRKGERTVVSEPIKVLDDDCSTPTPTLTAVPTPTWTASPVPTDTVEPTATVTASLTPVPTSTQRPRPIYLPVLMREKCVPQEVHADVVLVIDVSTSMRRTTRTGRTKLAATQDAARQFVSLMDLTADARGRHDQVGVVGFNREAWIEAPLGPDPARILGAIDALSLRMAELTRLDLALQVGAKAILEGARRPGNAPVMVLLTDGLPNQVPYAEDGTVETTVLRAAQAAKAAGIDVFTIAIGAPDDTNPDLLAACASGVDHYFYAPDPEDLAAIYQAIAHSIDCPRSAFWGRR